MKKAFFIVICILLSSLILCPAFAAETQDEYIKVTTDKTVFYLDSPIASSPDSFPVFELKKGVYVKFITTEGDYYKVEYYGATGYVKSSDFTEKGSSNPPQKYSGLSQYYHDKITLHLTDTAVAKGNNSLSFAPFVPSLYTANPTSSDELTLLGTYTHNSVTYLYVSFTASDNMVYSGSIDKNYTDWDESVNPITAPVAPKPTPETNVSGSNSGSSNTDTDNTPSGQEPTNNLLRVLLIIGICIPAFIIVYLIFKPVKPSTSRRNSEGNQKRRGEDYEDFE